MDRKCGRCGAILRQYNQGTLCFACQVKKRDELTEKIGDGLNYNVDDMCSILGLDFEQVRRLGRKGVIPGRIPGIKQHLYLRELVDQWLRGGGKLSTPEAVKHYSELALTTQKLVEILDYYYKANRSSIMPFISSDFPYTANLPESPILDEREFSNLTDHLKDEIPELASIAEYPTACKRYLAGDKSENEEPVAEITGDLILRLKLAANQGNFTGRCPDCPS